jgi:type I restriction enzyme M protein
MAMAENIGYDATGRKTFSELTEKETDEEKIVIQRSDLFDYRVTYELSAGNSRKAIWNERHREIVPNTGLVSQWREFERDPTRFFV